MKSATIIVKENGQLFSYTHEDLLRYHGTVLLNGVAHAFQVMRLALPLLDNGNPPERREIEVRTPFTPGRGARDAIEMVTRAVTDNRYHIDPSLRRSGRGPRVELYYFEFSYRGKTVKLQVKDGLLLPEFIAIVDKENKTPEEKARIVELRAEMAAKLLSLPCDEVYEVVN
ncbi:Uncharacterised protein [Oligella ureolytica]|uniref:Uncharacterized protein n=1 Tax=Oligella ureolytica TaxID=90244 RepID=A0A378XIE6_9BURK|nr:hypothetical protein [Oligella ureolytica]QPT39679.1 hypothetical protein I6G29_11150 [Oligella ureolytica]SUA52456.1 Uncharacterised protein [Oligella ureolytica]SUA57170.1 Uncharacterised protein [Oligella ureolytica]